MLDSMRSLGLTLEAEGKLVEAEALHREALVLWRKRHEIGTPHAQWQLECLVRVLVAQEKLADAEQILDEILTPETLRNPSIIRALDLRIDLSARQGQWEKAAADAARALELQPTDQNRFHALAPLLVITHNHPGYEQLRRRVLTTFAGTTDPVVADRVAKDCLLLPCSDTELSKIDRLADIAVNAGEEASRRNEYLVLSVPFFQTCKASSEYRQGHFAESIDWAQKVVQSSQLYAKAQVYSVLAMAQWRLGHTETARSTLAEADRSIKHISGARNDQGEWLALIFARLWLEEANQLINSEKDQSKLP
jgi:tetratricopeptide (TPR) repeat protein